MYEGIQSDIVSSNRIDENSDINTTYLGKIECKEGKDKLKAEESFPISENGYTLGRLLVQSVSYYWTWALASPSCQNCFICYVNHYTPYQNLPLLCRKYKLGMTVHWYTIYNACYCGNTQSQIQNLHFDI